MRETGGAGRFLRTKEVVQILGISRRQLLYWVQTDLVTPSVKTRDGRHRYTFEDLDALKTIKRLIDAGVSVQCIRSILPNLPLPLSNLVLIATGRAVFVFRENGEGWSEVERLKQSCNLSQTEARTEESE